MLFTSGQSSLLGSERCGYCRGDLVFDFESGETVCTMCGTVSSRVAASYSVPVTSGSREEELGSLQLGHVAEVSTVIGGLDVDAKGKRISPGRDLRQMRKLDHMVAWDSRKRRLRKVSMELRRIAQTLGLSAIIAERGYEIYLKEFSAKSVKAKSLAAVAAASLCAACRELDVARPTNDIVALHAGVNKKLLRHYYRVLVSDESAREAPSPANYVSSIATKASLKGQTERLAIEILAKVKGDPTLTGKRPISLAVAALYLASAKADDRTTQLRLAYAAGVTPITIRKRSLEITKILEQK